jgi:hypothetical protein
MPALSGNQRIVAAIGLHNPGKLYARNRSILSMSKPQLQDFASTKGLKVKRVPKPKGVSLGGMMRRQR